MSTTKRLSEFASALGATLKGVAKIAVQSRPVPRPEPPKGKRLIILANGPSLRDTIDSHAGPLRSTPTMAVNFFANTPEFDLLRPPMYVLADPHFFTAAGQANVDGLWRRLAEDGRDIDIYVPVQYIAAARARIGADAAGRLRPFNCVGVEGFATFERMAYSRGMAMPRPRNVLIPAIMVALRAGYTEIYLTGADHSWMSTIRVTDGNEVVSVQPHFYTDSGAETSRITTAYRDIRLHEVIYSFYTAFAAYHRIRRYADSCGARIYNATPGSFIDAFERRPLPQD